MVCLKLCCLLWQDLPGLSKSVSDALEKLTKAVSSVTDTAGDPELAAYLQTALTRQQFGKLWIAETVENAKSCLGDSDGVSTDVPVSSPRGTADEEKEPLASPKAHSEVEAGSEAKEKAADGGALESKTSEGTSVAGSNHNPPLARRSSSARSQSIPVAVVSKLLSYSIKLLQTRTQWLFKTYLICGALWR